MNRVAKLGILMRLAVSSPLEFYDRVATVVEVSWDRMFARPAIKHAGDTIKELTSLEGAFRRQIYPLLRESCLLEIEKQILEGSKRLGSTGPFTLAHNADFSVARLSYLICRVLSPEIVLETGVAYGVTSAFILQAMAVNGRGELLSIDLPPLGVESDLYVGTLIPQRLRSRWHLHRGPSKRVLPKLLTSLGKIDLFIHDSLHTYRNMSFEFETVWRCLRRGGVLIADDVGENRAFEEFSKKVNPPFRLVARQEKKDSLFGVLVKAP